MISFQYASSTVWLDDLGPVKDPSTIELCGRHANRQAAPKGWTGHDRRAATLRTSELNRSPRPDDDLRAQAS